MVQPPGTSEEAPKGFRARHRAARHRAFLDQARRIVIEEGPDALTMQRVTEELGTSVGGIYLYFPTKDHLVAELQREALHVLHTSYLLGQSHLDERLASSGVDPSTAALARASAAARFWIEADGTLPIHISLARRLIIDPRAALEPEQSTQVLPGVLRILEDTRDRLDQAAGQGALDDADGLDRAVGLLTSLNGVLLATNVQEWDPRLFDGRRLAAGMARSILLGWGAEAEQLAAADALVDATAEAEGLAPDPGIEPTGE